VFGFAGVRILRPGDEGDGGTAEAAYVRRLLGDMGVRMWVNGRNIARRYVTRGWWAELKLVPKLKIMKRIR
jgi:alpha-1,6-mannosyltransferase